MATAIDPTMAITIDLITATVTSIGRIMVMATGTDHVIITTEAATIITVTTTGATTPFLAYSGRITKPSCCQLRAASVAFYAGSPPASQPHFRLVWRLEAGCREVLTRT